MPPQKRLCRYECGTTLQEYDEKEGKYRELDMTLHTKERCKEMKIKNLAKDVGQKGEAAVGSSLTDKNQLTRIEEDVKALRQDFAEMKRAMKQYAESLAQVSFQTGDQLNKDARPVGA